MKAYQKPRRPTLTEAKAQFVHRYTMEHIPAWAKAPHYHTTEKKWLYYAPQYRTDQEWYSNTLFHGETELADARSCYTSNESWPLGKWLDERYTK